MSQEFWQPMTTPANRPRSRPWSSSAAKALRSSTPTGDATSMRSPGACGMSTWGSRASQSNAQSPISSINSRDTRRSAARSMNRRSNSRPKVLEWTRPGGMARAFFTSGGSDIVETALSLARQYRKLRGEAGRTEFTSVMGSYHGTHFGGASVTGTADFRAPYEPLLPGCFHIPGPNTYRTDHGEFDPAALANICLGALESGIAFQGPDTVPALIMEPIQGAGGVYVPHESFMQRAQEICTRYGVVLIADEVVTGFGRSGSWLGSHLRGVQPDMMYLAKAITTGYFPLGACLVNDEIAETFESSGSPGSVSHGYTYSGHPVVHADGLAALAETKRLDVVDNAAARGSQLFDGGRYLQTKHDIVGHVRGGHGLAIALELVSDRATKKPLDTATVERLHEAIYEAGAAVRVSGNEINLSPALIVQPEHVQRIVDALDAGLAVA